MKENVDYKLIEYVDAETESADHWTVEILAGDFEGVKLKYGTISIDEENSSLHFNYDIVESPYQDLSENNPDLIEVVKNIMNNIMMDAIDLIEAQDLKGEN